MIEPSPQHMPAAVRILCVRLHHNTYSYDKLGWRVLVKNIDRFQFPDSFIWNNDDPGIVAILPEMPVAEVCHRASNGPRSLSGAASGTFGCD